MFMVWAPTEHHLETVHYDPEFWAEMEESLRRFYLDCLLPEIVDPRAPRGRMVRSSGSECSRISCNSLPMSTNISQDLSICFFGFLLKVCQATH